jgi:hypothetical protein
MYIGGGFIALILIILLLIWLFSPEIPNRSDVSNQNPRERILASPEASRT